MVDMKNIIDKRETLFALAPFSEGVKALKRRGDLVDFAYSDLRLNGSKLTKEGVSNILDGNPVPDAPVLEHRLCEAHRKLLSKFDDMMYMSLETDGPLLDEICKILSSADSPPYREGAPLLYHIDHVPGDSDRIPIDVSDMFKAVRRKDSAGQFYGDFCVKAAVIHMYIIEIYPYKEGFSEMAARAAAQYELIRAGYFPVDPDVSEAEYNRINTYALKNETALEYAELLQKAVLKKLDMLIDAVKRGI